jgi:thiamine-phosphate pyrophosphorylase
MPLEPDARFPLMCITLDGIGIPHREQVARLCAAGARWVQLRMKGAPRGPWADEARAAALICHGHGAVLIVNDDIGIALECGADGVHLGALDAGWAEARRALGPRRLVGGTVNCEADADRAAAAGCLDYAGVGPLRFTGTKSALSPVLGIGGVRRLIARLRGLPAWVIGGVEAADLADIERAGAAGAAVSSALFRGGRIEENLRALVAAWPRRGEPAHAAQHNS